MGTAHRRTAVINVIHGAGKILSIAQVGDFLET